jgi:hypothetical protein
MRYCSPGVKISVILALALLGLMTLCKTARILRGQPRSNRFEREVPLACQRLHSVSDFDRIGFGVERTFLEESFRFEKECS